MCVWEEEREEESGGVCGVLLFLCDAQTVATSKICKNIHRQTHLKKHTYTYWSRYVQRIKHNTHAASGLCVDLPRCFCMSHFCVHVKQYIKTLTFHNDRTLTSVVPRVISQKCGVHFVFLCLIIFCFTRKYGLAPANVHQKKELPKFKNYWMILVTLPVTTKHHPSLLPKKVR